jgi:hypothetical protein
MTLRFGQRDLWLPIIASVSLIEMPKMEKDVTVSSRSRKASPSLPHSNGLLAASLRTKKSGAGERSESLVSGVESTNSMALRIGPATIAAR